MHLTIVISSENSLRTLFSIVELFTNANKFLIKNNKQRRNFFEIEIVGLEPDMLLSKGPIKFSLTKSYKSIDKTDLVIIIPTDSNDKKLSNDQNFVSWIKDKHFKSNTMVACLSKGFKVLGSLGLLYPTLANFSSSSKLKSNKKMATNIIEKNKVIFSNVEYDGVKIALYLIEKLCNEKTFVHCCKIINPDYNSNKFEVLEKYKNHNDEDIIIVQKYIEGNIEKKISIEFIANLIGTSKRNLTRRFKAIIGITPKEYIQIVKIEVAKEKFQSNQRVLVKEVMYSLGYNDTVSFRQLFKKHVGVCPVEFKSRFNQAV